MAKSYILYNPSAGDPGTDIRQEVSVLEVVCDEVIFVDVKEITNCSVFLKGLEPDANLILCGGDGTLNRFINRTKGLELPREVYYYALGSGNDFARDLGHGKEDAPVYNIRSFLQDLPTVEAKDIKSLFLNNVGFGLDGYCCEKGERLRQKAQKRNRKKKINYTAIAVGGLLGGYRPVKAAVTVDGVEHTYKNVWLAPVMKGRYYGGGMMAAPDQDRSSETGEVSVLVLHCRSRLKALCIFPSIFKGNHLRHTKNAELLTGHEITVEFSSRRALQIDGEVVRDVRRYRVIA